MTFTDQDKLSSLVDPATVKKTPSANPKAADASAASTEAKSDATAPRVAKAVFAGGCFWCVEAVFEQLDGVIDAMSGYAGGSKETANYKSVSLGITDHAEAVQITFDPKKITLGELLDVHFATHDPTTLNRQGADRGRHYRSAIFFANDAEKKVAQDAIARAQKKLGDDHKVVTTLEPLDAFYPAETKHQDFVRRNPPAGLRPCRCAAEGRQGAQGVQGQAQAERGRCRGRVGVTKR